MSKKWIKNKRKTFKNQILMDFETLHADTNYFKNLKEKDTRIIYWYGKNLNNNDEYQGVSGDDFLTFLNMIDKNTTIWFHNLSFDGTYIIPLLENSGWNVVCLDVVDDNFVLTKGLNPDGNLKSHYFKYFTNKNVIYEIHLARNTKQFGYPKRIEINIRCSYLMLSSSIDALGKSLGIQKRNDKLGSKFYVREPEKTLKEFIAKNSDFVEYCKRDVEIAIKSLKAFQDAINLLPTIKEYVNDQELVNGLNVLDKSLTVAGLGRYLMEKIYVAKYERKNYKNLCGTKLLKIDYETHKFIKGYNEMYKGGFVQFNPKFQINEKEKFVNDGIKIDVVSAYPYQMTKSLPYGKVFDEQEWNIEKAKYDKEFVHGLNYQCWVVVKIISAKPTLNSSYCAVLSNLTNMVDENGLKYRYNPKIQKDFIGNFTLQEWNELQHWFEFNIQEIEYYYQHSAPYLKEYANEIIAKKTEYSKQKKGAFKQAMKILANSAYGSLGIRMQFETMVQTTQKCLDLLQKDKWYEFNDVLAKNGIKKMKYVGNSFSKSFKNTKCIRLLEQVNQDKKYYNIACAAAITSFQRVYLWETIRKIGVEYFAYSDTDSIIFVNFPQHKRKEIESMCGDELGMWEIEKRYIKGFVCRKAKDYGVIYLNEKGEQIIEYKSAGFSSDNEQLKEMLIDYFYDDESLFSEKWFMVKDGSLSRVKYPSGILLVNIDKINNISSV